MNYNKKLFLIDAFPIIYQGFYALKKNPLFTSFGLNTSPIINFTHFIINILNEENPKYMAIIFDGNQISFRKKIYKEYKSNRKKTPIEINISIPYINKILKAFQIFFIYSNYGYEADDIIGTIAKKAENKDYNVYILSSDKDFLQLVTNNIKIYIPSSKNKPKKILGLNEIKSDFGVNDPKQMIDLFSMMGDYSDNIPGLPGIGKKNAIKFVNKYGSIEGLFHSINELNKNLKKKIEFNKEIGLLYKKLITINTNISYINFCEKKFCIKNPIFTEVKNIFKELEFRMLFNKFCQYYKKINNL
ncbi:5'-3' exonuclease [Blattabacterium cuenoti]|uniref:5'-3' exonuclease n=1 Tax=Blattabacterium cuenoti TaxID=1653831 RepID=UPI00163B9D0F|nr:5'-3' exonuclease H3TH domain-containing protein [Blattabacterium cuenoti]